jgi:hypothetical protein
MKLSKAKRREIEKALAKRVPPVTKAQLKQQRLQNLKQNLTLAQREARALKLQMRSLRGAE